MNGQNLTNEKVPTEAAISALVDGIISGEHVITEAEALSLSQLDNKEPLYEGAHRLTHTLMGNGFDTCSIINVKSGNCPEDCRWCAQSRHYTTGAGIYPVLPVEESVAQAIYNRKQGVNRFSLVASGRSQSRKEMEKIVATFKAIREACDVHCCASLGLLSEENLRQLCEAGVTTYHCNMETAPSYFLKMCSTHKQEEKVATIEAARRQGMRICSGGIIGMGETQEQRIEFAFFLRSLGVQSIPINVLHPIPGTPLEKTSRLSEEEYLTTVALFRFINPTAYLRFSGGRDLLPISTVRKAMYIAINSAITGDMLTTVGARCEEDMALIKEMGYTTKKNTDWEIIKDE